MKEQWIAIAGRKGGGGKTSLALGLAGHYARAGLRVLLLDLDPQGSASLALGIDAHGGHLAAALAGEGEAETVSFETINAAPVLVLAGGPELENANLARPLRFVAAGMGADVVLVDCPPGHADLDRLAMDAADVLLICTEAHRLGIAGAGRVLSEARLTETPPACALVLGRMDERRALDRAAPELLCSGSGPTPPLPTL